MKNGSRMSNKGPRAALKPPILVNKSPTVMWFKMYTLFVNSGSTFMMMLLELKVSPFRAFTPRGTYWSAFKF